MLTALETGKSKVKAVQGQGTCTSGAPGPVAHRGQHLAGSCMAAVVSSELRWWRSRPPNKDTNPSPESRTSQRPHLLMYPIRDGFSMRFWGHSGQSHCSAVVLGLHGIITAAEPQLLICICCRRKAQVPVQVGVRCKKWRPSGNLSRRNLRALRTDTLGL